VAPVEKLVQHRLRWIKGDNYNAINVLHAVVLWTLWEKRNNVCFQGECWRSVQELLGSCARTAKNWMLVNKEGDAAKLDAWARELELRSRRPSRLTCEPMAITSFDNVIRSSLGIDAELSIASVTDDGVGV
jgi:hypothetical protein